MLFKHFGGSLIAATQNAFVHTLSKRVHNCSVWTLSDLSRTLFECFESSLTAAALNAIVHTLFKMCSKSQSLDSKLKPSTFSLKMLEFLLSSTGLAETVVALATYSLTSVR